MLYKDDNSGGRYSGLPTRNGQAFPSQTLTMLSGYSCLLCLGQPRWSGRCEWPPNVPDATVSPRHETSAQEQSGDVKDTF